MNKGASYVLNICFLFDLFFKTFFCFRFEIGLIKNLNKCKFGFKNLS